MSPDREVLVEYTISETTSQTSITKHAGAFPLGLSVLGLRFEKLRIASAAKPLTVTVTLVDLSQVGSSIKDKNQTHVFCAIDCEQPAGRFCPCDKNRRGNKRTAGSAR